MSNTKLAMFLCFILILVVASVLFAPVLGLFAIAAILAYLIDPAVCFLQRRMKTKKWLAVTLTLLAVIAIMVLALELLFPVVIKQVWSLVEGIPAYMTALLGYLEKLDKFLREKNIDGGLIENAQNYLRQNTDKLAQTAGTLLGRVANVAMTLPQLIVNVLFVFMLTIYFLFDGRKMVKGFLSFFSDKNKPVVQRILKSCDNILWRYIKSKVVLALGMAVIEWIGFMIIGLQNALLLAIIAFVLDFVPYVGSFVAGAVAALVALFAGGWSLGIGVLVFVTIVQQIQGNVIAPKMQADSVGVHPAVGIFALLACGKLMGAVGLFVAIPIAGFVQIVFKEMAAKFKNMK